MRAIALLLFIFGLVFLVLGFSSFTESKAVSSTAVSFGCGLGLMALSIPYIMGNLDNPKPDVKTLGIFFLVGGSALFVLATIAADFDVAQLLSSNTLLGIGVSLFLGSLPYVFMGIISNQSTSDSNE